MTLSAPNWPLFQQEELAGYLGIDVQENRAVMAERVAWGWLKPVLGLSERPNPVPEELFSWAIELGAIAHENPSGLQSQALGPGSQTYSLERRQEILAQVAAHGRSAPAARGSFPPAPCYPDAVEPLRRRRQP